MRKYIFFVVFVAALPTLTACSSETSDQSVDQADQAVVVQDELIQANVAIDKLKNLEAPAFDETAFDESNF